MCRGGIKSSHTSFSSETLGWRKADLKQSKGRPVCLFTQHIVKTGCALCSGSINWFTKGTEKLVEDKYTGDCQRWWAHMQLHLWEHNAFQSSNGTGVGRIIFPPWCLLYSFQEHFTQAIIKDRTLGQMDAGSDVLSYHVTQERIAM